MCSLAPEADDLAAIKKISTAGGIPYVDAKQTKLFVVAIEVEQKRKKRKKTKNKEKVATRQG